MFQCFELVFLFRYPTLAYCCMSELNWKSEECEIISEAEKSFGTKSFHVGMKFLILAC